MADARDELRRQRMEVGIGIVRQIAVGGGDGEAGVFERVVGVGGGDRGAVHGGADQDRDVADVAGIGAVAGRVGKRIETGVAGMGV